MRVKALRERLETPGFFTLHPPNVRYLSGFTGSFGVVALWEDRALFITDGRYETQAQEEVELPVKVLSPGESWTDVLADFFREEGEISFEAEYISYDLYEKFKAKLGDRLVPTRGLVLGLRRKKEPREIELIKRAQAITEEIFSWVLENLEPGEVTERELAAEMEYQMRLLGADGPAFSSIVAFGPGSALPHYSPKDKKIEENGVLLLDFGAKFQGYASDMTRTLWIGPKDPPEDFTRVYRAVLDAQLRGIEAAKPGAPSREVDRAAREFFEKLGLAQRFTHGTGHGVGLEVHELPRVHLLAEETLSPGDVITVEPGLYFPGEFGVRIEDMVLITQDGPDVLTRAKKELTVL